MTLAESNPLAYAAMLCLALAVRLYAQDPAPNPQPGAPASAPVLSLQNEATSQAVSDNHVLDLDGNEGWVELPSNIFNHLTEATVEGWIKFDRFLRFGRFFDFGSARQAMTVNQMEGENTLRYEIWDSSKVNHSFAVPNILETNRWYHVAAVSGPAGMRLYLNGALVGMNDFSGSFSTVGDGQHNLLGRNNWKNEPGPFRPDLKGQMDEVRIWSLARNEEDIRRTMFDNLSGLEHGLVGLWNFNDGTPRDSSTNKHHGKFMGNARTAQARRPSAPELQRPSVISARVIFPAGSPPSTATVVIEQAGRVISQGATDAAGNYRLAIYSLAGLVEITATAGDLGVRLLDLKIEPGEQYDFELKLQNAVSLSGSVLGLDNSPQQGVSVQLLEVSAADDPSDAAAPSRVIATAQSDKTGRYQFVNVRPGNYSVRCQLPGRFIDYESGKAITIAQGTQVENIHFKFAPFKKGFWKQFTYLNGLADDRVLCIHADPNGMMWIGTEGGLSRYDGKEFINFTVDDGLSDNRVYSVLRDRAGVLWLGTGRGVTRFEGGTFAKWEPNEQLTTVRVQAITEDPQGRLWFGGPNSLWRFDGKNLTQLGATPTTAALINCLVPGANGTIWIGSWGSVSQYDSVNFVPLSNQELNSVNVRALLSDTDGVLWCGTGWKGVFRYDGRNFQQITSSDGLISDHITSIFRDDDGTLWFGAANGVTRYDGKAFANYFLADAESPYDVLAIYRDREGFLWLGTSGGGLWRYDENVITSFTAADGLAANQSARTVVTSDGAVWIGTGWFTPARGIIRYHEGRFETFTQGAEIPFNSASSLLETSDRNLYLGTFQRQFRFATYPCPDDLRSRRQGGHRALH